MFPVFEINIQAIAKFSIDESSEGLRYVRVQGIRGAPTASGNCMLLNDSLNFHVHNITLYAWESDMSKKFNAT